MRTRRRCGTPNGNCSPTRPGRQQQWAAEHLDLASLAGELRRLGEQVGQLRALLRQHGVDPQDGAA
jgi:hypothetical protein